MTNQQPSQSMVKGACASPFLMIGGLTRAFIPSRVFLAFIAILLLASMGRIWDAFATPVAAPNGLVSGRWTQIEQDAAAQQLRSGVMSTLGSSGWQAIGAPSALDPVTAMKALRVAHEQGVASVSTQEGYLRLAKAIDQARGRGPYEAMTEAISESAFVLVIALTRADISGFFTAISQTMFLIPSRLFAVAPFFTLCFALWSCVVLGLLGTAVCRSAAWDFSQERTPSSRAVVAWARARWGSGTLAPIFPLVVAGVCTGIVWCIGWTTELPVLNAVGSVLFGVALILMAFAVLACVLVVLGLPLMLPAVACDGCDGPEAAQRSGAYVLARPLLALGCFLLGTVLFALGTLAADWFVTQVFNSALDVFCSTDLRASIRPLVALRPYLPIEGPSPMSLGGTAAAGGLEFWRSIMSCIVGATMLSLVLSLSTRAYLIIRQNCDGQDLEEVEA